MVWTSGLNQAICKKTSFTPICKKFLKYYKNIRLFHTINKCSLKLPGTGNKYDTPARWTELPAETGNRLFQQTTPTIDGLPALPSWCGGRPVLSAGRPELGRRNGPWAKKWTLGLKWAFLENNTRYLIKKTIENTFFVKSWKLAERQREKRPRSYVAAGQITGQATPTSKDVIVLSSTRSYHPTRRHRVVY